MPYSLKKGAFWAYKRYFTNEVAACKFPRHNMACLTGFAWSKDAFVGVCVSASQSMGICPLNGKRGPEYIFSIPDTSKTSNSMERATPNMAPN
jgi:hypothetical protein